MGGCSTGGCGSIGPGAQKDEKDIAVENSLQKIKSKFIVMSGKGGVGKTSTSVNLSLSLARKGCSVGLLDVDLHGPDIPRMLGMTGLLDVNANRKLIPMKYSENLSTVSVESLTPNKDSAVIWRGPLKYAAIRQFIGDVEWGNLDSLIIDSPPGTGDEPLTIAQNIPDAKAIIVSTPQEISLADVRKSISFCKTVEMEIFGIIENMSGYACPHCGEVLELFGSGGAEKMALETGIPFLGRVPFDNQVVSCGDSGKAFIEQFPDSPVAKAFDDIADKIGSTIKNQS